MSTLKNNYGGVAASLSSIAIAIGTFGFSATALADSHIVSRDFDTGLIYNSVLNSYRTLDGNEKSEWKQSNDAVGEIGGWRTYANEAYEANQQMKEEQLDDAGFSEAGSKPIANEEMDSDVAADEPLMAKAPNEMMKEMSEIKSSSRMPPKQIVGLAHQSATDLHRPYEEVTLQGWKAANDRVGEIGGWRVYANEAYQANKRMAEEAGAN